MPYISNFHGLLFYDHPPNGAGAFLHAVRFGVYQENVRTLFIQTKIPRTVSIELFSEFLYSSMCKCANEFLAEAIYSVNKFNNHKYMVPV